MAFGNLLLVQSYSGLGLSMRSWGDSCILDCKCWSRDHSLSSPIAFTSSSECVSKQISLQFGPPQVTQSDSLNREFRSLTSFICFCISPICLESCLFEAMSWS